MDLQQQQLQQLSDWLSQTEQRIMKIETEPPAKDLQVYKERIEQHKVNSLSLAALACDSARSSRCCGHVAHPSPPVSALTRLCPRSPATGAAERPGGGAGEGELSDAHGGGCG